MINSLFFDRFKALKQSPIPFSQLTILAGLNSAGKSSVIQGILLLRSLAEHCLAAGPGNAMSIQDFPLNGNYLLSLGSTIETISKDTGKVFNFLLSADKHSIRVNFSTDKSLADTVYSVNALFTKEFLESCIAKSDFYYLNAERLGPRIRHFVNENSSNTNIHCGYRGEFTVEVLVRTRNNTEFFPVEEAKWLNHTKLPGFQDIISYSAEWLKFITPGADLVDAEVLGKIRSATINLNGNTPPNVGFGISYSLPIVVTGLLAKKGSIMIVENPEAHLHPKGQSNIGYFLGQMASAGIQVIIETHSEHIVNGIRRAALELPILNPSDISISFFKGVNNDKQADISTINILDNGDLSDFPIDFFDQVRQDLMELRKLSLKNNG